MRAVLYLPVLTFSALAMTLLPTAASSQELVQGPCAELAVSQTDDGPPTEHLTTNEYQGGRLVATNTDTWRDDSIDRITRYEYDEQGRLARSTEDYGGDGVVDEALVHIYNDAGQLSQTQRLDPDGAVLALTELTYDGEGRVVSEVTDETGDGIAEGTITYEYPDPSQMIEREVNIYNTVVQVYSYGTDGHEQVRTFDVGDDGNIEFRTSSFYDGMGRLIREERRGHNGTDFDVRFDYSCWQ